MPKMKSSVRDEKVKVKQENKRTIVLFDPRMGRIKAI